MNVAHEDFVFSASTPEGIEGKKKTKKNVELNIELIRCGYMGRGCTEPSALMWNPYTDTYVCVSVCVPMHPIYTLRHCLGPDQLIILDFL